MAGERVEIDNVGTPVVNCKSIAWTLGNAGVNDNEVMVSFFKKLYPTEVIELEFVYTEIVASELWQKILSGTMSSCPGLYLYEAFLCKNYNYSGVTDVTPVQYQIFGWDNSKLYYTDTSVTITKGSDPSQYNEFTEITTYTQLVNFYNDQPFGTTNQYYLLRVQKYALCDCTIKSCLLKHSKIAQGKLGCKCNVESIQKLKELYESLLLAYANADYVNTSVLIEEIEGICNSKDCCKKC